SLKLLPAPAARMALIYERDGTAIADAALWPAFPRLEPAVLTVVGRARAAAGAGGNALPGASGGAFWLTIGFEDDPPRVQELAAATTRALGAPGLVLEGPEAEALWRRLADLEESGPARLTFAS